MSDPLTVDLLAGNNEEDFETIPDGVQVVIHIPMICPHCASIHYVPLNASCIHKNGISHMIHMVQERLVADGWRVPAEEDFRAFAEKLEAKMQEAEQAKDARPGTFFVPGIVGRA